MVLITNSMMETEQVGEQFAKSLKPGDTIALYGGMGMGKTALVRGIARGLQCDTKEVSSPTFAIVHEYAGQVPLFHFDMYRITSPEELFSTGFFEYLEMDGIVVIEWSENIAEFLPEGSCKIFFEHGDGENSRRITIQEELV